MGLLSPEKEINGQKHILAYITPGEAETLENLGGQKTITEEGIPAYPEFDSYTASSLAGTSSAGSGMSRSEFEGGAYAGTGNAGDGVIQQYNTPEDIDSTYLTGEEFNVTPEVQQKSIGEQVVDYIKGGGLIGAGLRKIGGWLDPENQYEGITGEDGYGEGDYVSTLDDWTESRGLGDDYSALDAEGQAFIDQEAYDAGWRSPAFQSLYEGGNGSNINNLTTSESAAINQLIPQASYAVANQTPIPSMVDQWFANNQAGTGLNSNYLNTYNTAKAQIANTMGMVDTSNQFGYSATPYGGLTAQNLATNPFNTELIRQAGLI